MPVKNFAATLSSAFFAAISPSRTVRRSSGSVPSMPICRPRLRNGSSIALTCASSASRPSLRAFSARLTRVWIWSVAGGTLAGITAILNQPGSFLRSFIVWLAIAAPKVATMTSTMAGRASSDIGSEPSRTMKTRRATSETTNPIRVAGSTGSALLAGREGDDGGARLGLLRTGRRAVGAAVHLVGGGQDAGAVLADLHEDLFHALRDDVLRAVDQEHDGVGVALDPLDEVGVEREPLSVQARHTDHGDLLLVRGGMTATSRGVAGLHLSSACRGRALSRTGRLTRGGEAGDLRG